MGERCARAIPAFASGIVWGDVSSWVSAVATILALVAAIWAGYTAKKLYDRETERDELARRAVRLDQARHVAAWLAVDPDRKGPHELALYVRNGSQEPVYNVDITLLVRDELGDLQEVMPRLGLATLPPGDRPQLMQLPPPQLLTVPTTTRPGVCVTIAFQDAVGVRWLRNHLGQLAELPQQNR